jgi:hypothetical protein
MVAVPLGGSGRGEDGGSYDTAEVCTLPLGGGALGDGDVGSGSESNGGCSVDGSEAVEEAAGRVMPGAEPTRGARLPPNRRSFNRSRKDGIFEDMLWIPTGVEEREKRKNIAETCVRALAGRRFRGTSDYLRADPASVMHNTYMQDST